MSISDFLTKDHKLPPFATYRQPLLLSILIVLLPNFFFWGLAWGFGLARPIINLDYIIPLIIFTAPIRWNLGKMVGGLLLIFCILIDFLMFAIQIFPFLDLASIRYLLPFISTAPTRLLVGISACIAYLILFLFGLNYIAKKTRFTYVLIFSILIGALGWSQRFEKYHETEGLRFGRANHYLAQNQSLLYWSEIKDDFHQLTKIEPVITPNPKENATRHFNQPYSNKLLLIVAESWGVAREPAVQRAILNAIYQQKDNLEFIQEGFFDFAGATVQGEMRELCNFNTSNGYAFSKLPEGTFDKCLPNILKKQGYQTIGLHGASSQLYDRNAWYPIVGFQKSLFGEHLPDLQRCYPFNGACDEAMLQLVADEFKQTGNQKTFVYWLSLTAHLPYDVSPMRSNRFNCEQLNVTSGDICNNMRLQSQLFDDLGEIIKRPEMKGVEVIVVGDHMPPIVGDVPLYKNLRWNDVSWLHFKVKE